MLPPLDEGTPGRHNDLFPAADGCACTDNIGFCGDTAAAAAILMLLALNLSLASRKPYTDATMPGTVTLFSMDADPPEKAPAAVYEAELEVICQGPHFSPRAAPSTNSEQLIQRMLMPVY